ncbi:hypothetical protein CCACVL1_10176, partial [Corchorus capsularis]
IAKSKACSNQRAKLSFESPTMRGLCRLKSEYLPSQIQAFTTLSNPASKSV